MCIHGVVATVKLSTSVAAHPFPELALVKPIQAPVLPLRRKKGGASGTDRIGMLMSSKYTEGPAQHTRDVSKSRDII
jgi:hypothetical protein